MFIKTLSDIGKLVRGARQDEEIKASDLSEKIESGQAVISRLEHGRTNATIKTLIRIAGALNKRLWIEFR